MIEDSTRRADDDVDAPFERLQLAEDRLAAVHGDDLDTELAAVLEDRLGHLHRQLARRHEDEGGGGRTTAPDRQRVQQREGEGGGLSGAGRRLPDEIATFDEVGDGFPLHRRRLFVAELDQGVEQLGA